MDKHDSDTDAQSHQNGNSKPSSEKESTLVDEPIRDATAPDDTNKEATTDSSREGVLNETPEKELVPQNDSEKEASDPNRKDEIKPTEEPTDDTEYPTAWRLVLITIALCFCVFCVALVSPRFEDIACKRLIG